MSALVALSIASEIYPLVKTGGLADVAGALPGALARENVAVRTLTPGYPAILRQARSGASRRTPTPRCSAARRRILAGKASGLELFVLDAPHLFARPGNPYLGPDGLDWRDNALRFAALARVGADIAKGALAGFAPESSTPTTGRQRSRRPISITTAARGRARSSPSTTSPFKATIPRRCSASSACPRAPWRSTASNISRASGFLKAGLQFADRITTVSPTYAREIMTPEFGMALDGLLRARADVVEGILNGIDDTGVEPRHRPEPRPELQRAAHRACARATRRPCSSGSA